MSSGEEVLRQRIVVIVVVLGLAFAALSAFPVMYMLVPLIERVIVASENSVGGRGNIWAIIIMAPVMLAWGASLLQSRPVIQVGLLIIAFPFLGRTRDFLNITILHFPPPSDWVERLGLTSLFIVVLFVAFLLRQVPMRRPGNKLFRRVEACLWLFVGLGTIAQLFHHEPMSAILLSFNGMAQYLLWFYVVVGAVCDLEDVRLLFACFSGMLVVNMLLRTFFTGVSYDLSWVGGITGTFRYNAGGLGWAGNYSILLTVGIVLCVGLLDLAKSRAANLMWLMVIAVLTIEMVFTFMRSAYAVFVLSLLLLLAFRATRRYATIVAVMLVLGLLVAMAFRPNDTKLVLGARMGFIATDWVRRDLFLLAIPDVLHDMGFGFGIANGPRYSTQWSDKLITAHNVFLSLTQDVGLWAALAWVGAVLTTVIELARGMRYQLRPEVGRLQIPLFVALVAWFIFANVTGYITAYYPVESTQVVYTLMALAVALRASQTDSVQSVPVQPEK